MADLVEFQGIIGVEFQDSCLLATALTHSSFVNENPGMATESNERLEFLGDAVLGLVVAEELYQNFPSLSEGEMTGLRAALVRRDTLARVAKAIRLGDFLFLGKGEGAGGGRDRVANLAGALEAVIAAAFLDGGAAAARDLVLRLLREELAQAVRPGAGVDFKSRLQEVVQSRYQAAPVYRLVAESGLPHEKTFTVEVMAGGAVLGKGTGRSKKLAETEAARSALESFSGFTE